MGDTLQSRHLFIFLIIAILLVVTIAAVSLGDDWQLLTSNTNTATTGSPSGMEIITSNGVDELAMLRGCTAGEIIKKQVAGPWACDSDITTSATGAGVVILDLADNGVNESASIGEIATTGDTNAIFTEPSADKLLITLTADWPKADLSDALASDPADCAASNFAISIVASGNLGCAQVNFTDLAGTATDAQVPNTITIDLAALATALAANGANCGAGSASQGVDSAGAAEGCFAVEEEAELGTTAITGNAADDQLLVGSAASAATWVALTNCVDSGGSHLNYTAATNTFSCGTSSSGYITVQEEGAGLTARAILNFIGATITCADNAGSVRTDCTISAGGSTNSFETWDTTSGTDPVADSATDTMILTAGTNISITGDAAADSITIAVVSPVTSATALAANGANCAAGSAPLGVDASGAAESCFAVLTTAGRSLTATGATVDADVELYTRTKSINILNPTTAETNKVQFYLPLAGTITRIVCSTDVGTATIQFDERAEATPNTAGTNVMTASLVCDATSEATAAFDNATIASRVPVNLQITATASTPTIVRIHVEYTQDD